MFRANLDNQNFGICLPFDFVVKQSKPSENVRIVSKSAHIRACVL